MVVHTQKELEKFATCLQDVYGSFELQGLSHSAPKGKISFHNTGPFDCAKISLKSIKLERSKLALKEVWDQHVFALLQRGGASKFAQNDSIAVLGPKDIVLLDSRSGCEMYMPDSCQLASFHLPRELVEVHGIKYGMRLDGTHGMGRFLSNILTTLADTYEVLDKDSSQLVTETVTRLLVSTLNNRDPKSEIKCDDLLISRIRKWSLEQIENPLLSPAAMAAEFNLSLRRLYRVFESQCATPSNWLWGLRLDEAHRLLSDVRHCEKSIIQIAFSVGFNDAAHFSRSFRKRFGLTPSDLRNRARS